MKAEGRPNPFSKDQLDESFSIDKEYLNARRRAKDRFNRYKSTIPVSVDRGEGVFRSIHIGDTHFSHDDSVIGAVERILKRVRDGDLVVTQGNLIDGVSNKFLNTNTTKVAYTLDEQELLVGSRLKPFADQNRLVPVGKNSCHEGWSDKTSTHDSLAAMIPQETSLLYIGGQVVFKAGDPDSGEVEVGRMELYHNPGKGVTKQSPEAGVREKYREIPSNHKDRPDALYSAHFHQLVAGVDVYHDPILRKDIQVGLGVVGASKGTADHPDTFVLSIGGSTKNQPADSGEGLVTIWLPNKHDEKYTAYPVADFDRADYLFDAIKVWEKIQKWGDEKEFRELITNSPGIISPRENFVGEKSVSKRSDNAATSEGEANIYKHMHHDIISNLPLKIQFISNLRMGSGSLYRDEVKSILQDIKNDTWSYFYAMRRLVNTDVPKLEERNSVLMGLSSLLSTAGDSLLGIMMTDSLVKSAWTKDIKRDKEVVSHGFYPGDYLHNESLISGTPLMSPETVSTINMGGMQYKLYLKDKLSHFTSLINPFHGLTRVSQVWGIDADVLVGGHTEVVGWRTWMRPFGQLEVVVPGGFSEYIEKGIENRVDYPVGGQGVILLPSKKGIYSFQTAQIGRDLHSALWLYEGLRKIKMIL